MSTNTKVKEKNKWKNYFFILLIIGVILSIFISIRSYDSGYTDAGIEWAESMNNLGDSCTKIQSETLNETINDFSKNCVKYMCENIFDANYIENGNFGKCDGDEYKSVGALEECGNLLFGD